AVWEADVNGNGTADKDEERYSVTYTDGVPFKRIFKDQVYGDLLTGTPTPEFKGTPARKGYVFSGWDPEWEDTVTKTVTYKAIWDEDVNRNGIADKNERKYTVTYTDGVKGERIFKNQVYDGLLSGTQTPAFQGKPTRKGYEFVGWEPTVAKTVTRDVTYRAVWKAAGTCGKLDKVPKTGDDGIVLVLGSLLVLSFCGATAVYIFDRKRNRV
ncbi:MAG: hypothetical protein ACI3V5_09980, partial [Faecousia sp.]